MFLLERGDNVSCGGSQSFPTAADGGNSLVPLCLLQQGKNTAKPPGLLKSKWKAHFHFLCTLSIFSQPGTTHQIVRRPLLLCTPIAPVFPTYACLLVHTPGETGSVPP